MIHENIFSEGIRLQGNEKMELFNNLTYFHDKSCQMYIDPNALCLCSIYQCNKDEILVVKTDIQMATFSNLFTQIMTGNKSDQAAYDFFKVSKEKFYEMGLNEEDLKEMVDEGVYFEYEDKTIILSKSFLYHLSRILNTSVFEHGMNPIRELFIANQLFEQDAFYITVRKKKDIYKAFYASSSENCSGKIVEICREVVRHMDEKGARIYKWVLTQKKTEISFYYPEYTLDGFEFGMTFRISDTGEYATSLANSVMAESTAYQLRDAILSKKNYGIFDVKAFIKEFEEFTEGTLEDYRKNLMKVPVIDTDALERQYQSINISKICGKKKAVKIRKSFLEEVKKGETKYKGMMPILKLPVLVEEVEVMDYIFPPLIRKIGDIIECLVRPNK